MAEYPGNPSLAPEVKEKILGTFRHTVNLYKQGKFDDTRVGCEFIIKMDPRFTLAQRLLDAAGGGAAVDADALLAEMEGGGGGGQSPLAEAREALEQRDFSRAGALAQQMLSAEPGNADAMQIGSQAQELLEAQPFVAQFLQKAREELQAGRPSEATKEVDKAASIDPGHPEVKVVRAAIGEALAPGDGGFEFEGDAQTIDLAVAPEPAAGGEEGFGFQFAPEGDDQPTIGLEVESPAPEFSFDPPETDAFAPAAPPPPPAVAAPSESAGADFTFEPAEPAAGEPTFSFEEASPEPAQDSPPPPPPEAPAGAEFSFDAAPTEAPQPPPPPPPPPPAAPAGGADFTFEAEPADESDNPQVQQLLAEGDRAFEGGDYQGAIDVWSRIFLIDVTSQEASERIDRAKKAKSQRDQQVEGVIAAAVEMFQAGDTTGAREKFNEALTIDPGNATARSYLDQLESGATGPKAEASGDRLLGPSTAAPAGGDQDILSEDILGDYQPPEEAPPEEGDVYEGPGFGEEGVEEAAFEPPPARKGIPLPVVLALVVVLGLGGGAVWWFFLRGEPATPEPVGPPPVTAEKQITTANVHLAGQEFGAAIAALEQVPQSDPKYGEVLAMIEEIKRQRDAASAPPAPPSQQDDPSVQEEFLEAKAQGMEALGQHEYIDALQFLDHANRIDPSDAEVSRSLDLARQKVSELSDALDSFNEGSYEAAIGLLWRLRQADPENADVERLLINAYYNLGVLELQGGTARKAADQFKEVLDINPDDVEAARNRRLADAYRNKAKDLMYRVYTKYLRLRSS